jgi:hypothetical protein
VGEHPRLPDMLHSGRGAVYPQLPCLWQSYAHAWMLVAAYQGRQSLGIPTAGLWQRAGLAFCVQIHVHSALQRMHLSPLVLRCNPCLPADVYMQHQALARPLIFLLVGAALIFSAAACGSSSKGVPAWDRDIEVKGRSRSLLSFHGRR